ncbi:MAG TPA: N-acetyltransferase [Thermoanaerobaculia bacterium]|jgi:ribosomal-protein-alanine N-acetyltransferase|nr:N-acetyltransferase [Thermoanaerobaculia bacterium]
MEIAIRRLSNDREARQCAAMMAATEPWLTLGRGFEECLAAVADPEREVSVAHDGTDVRGFIILNMRGAFIGYIQTVCVDAAARGSGIGTSLVGFAERRIFAETPNVFLCVSSFNPRARALYERLGYERIGEIKDYLIAGASEFLMRKTIGPLRTNPPSGSGG